MAGADVNIRFWHQRTFGHDYKKSAHSAYESVHALQSFLEQPNWEQLLENIGDDSL